MWIVVQSFNSHLNHLQENIGRFQDYLLCKQVQDVKWQQVSNYIKYTFVSTLKNMTQFVYCISVHFHELLPV